jgi:hypothetical protein
MVRTAAELLVDRLLKQAEAPVPDTIVSFFRVYFSEGVVELHSAAEDCLYHILPLIREIEPGLEARIMKERPGFKVKVPGSLGPVPEGYSESDLTIVGPDTTPAEKEHVRESMMDDVRSDNPVRMAEKDPGMAVVLAKTISDPAKRATALDRISQEKLKNSEEGQADSLIQMARSAMNSDAKDDGERLALLVALARSQSQHHDSDLWDTLSRGLELAESVFAEATKITPGAVGFYYRKGEYEGPGYSTPRFSEANLLIRIGMEKEMANTLGWLAKEHDPALKAYLLISAAEGLWNKQKSSIAASAPAAQEKRTTTR